MQCTLVNRHFPNPSECKRQQNPSKCNRHFSNPLILYLSILINAFVIIAEYICPCQLHAMPARDLTLSQYNRKKRGFWNFCHLKIKKSVADEFPLKWKMKTNMDMSEYMVSPFDLGFINQIFDCALQWMQQPSIAGHLTESCNREMKRHACYQISFFNYSNVT